MKGTHWTVFVAMPEEFISPPRTLSSRRKNPHTSCDRTHVVNTNEPRNLVISAVAALKCVQNFLDFLLKTECVDNATKVHIQRRDPLTGITARQLHMVGDERGIGGPAAHGAPPIYTGNNWPTVAVNCQFGGGVYLQRMRKVIGF